MIQLVGFFILALYAPRINAQSGNPYTGKSVWVPDHYTSEVNTAAALVTNSTLKAKMLKVAWVPTFTWIDTVAKVADLPNQLAAAGSSVLQIVVYDLPNRNCYATSSPLHGDFAFENDGATLYRQYIDAIVSAIKKSPGSTVVAVVEPNSLTNLIIASSDPTCGSYRSQYLDLVIYASKSLASAGIYVYLAGGNGGWLSGWEASIRPSAQLFAHIYTESGSSSFMRGLATNVGGYNALLPLPPSVPTTGQLSDESSYISTIAPLLASSGWNATFIVEQGRSGRPDSSPGLKPVCNLNGAGIGIRPTTDTENKLIDAIVWVKPPGESDGTSETNAPRYDSTCKGPKSKVPSPGVGEWFQAYFVDLVNFANPELL